MSKKQIGLPVPGVINVMKSLWYTYYTYVSEFWGLAAMYETMSYLEQDPDNGFWFRAFVGFVAYVAVQLLFGITYLKNFKKRVLAEYEVYVDVPDEEANLDETV